jgi:hypothetical protein
MRRWFVLLLVLMLPLRGWLGEAMAGEMLHLSAAAVAGHAVEASSHGHGPHADCAGHAHASEAQPDAKPAFDADCRTCASCQACSAVALAAQLPVRTAASFSHPQPQSVSLAFSSAEPHLAFKPPRP